MKASLIKLFQVFSYSLLFSHLLPTSSVSCTNVLNTYYLSLLSHTFCFGSFEFQSWNALTKRLTTTRTSTSTYLDNIILNKGFDLILWKSRKLGCRFWGPNWHFWKESEKIISSKMTSIQCISKFSFTFARISIVSNDRIMMFNLQNYLHCSNWKTLIFRSWHSFNSILDIYRTGLLHLNNDMCALVLQVNQAGNDFMVILLCK